MHMKHLLTLLATLFLANVNNSFSQLLCRFNWDENPVTEAQNGPNAISVSGSATSSINGVNGTNGLNSGLPKQDINLVLPAAALMSIRGLDFSIDFQREESRGDFLTCGNGFAFGIIDGNLYIKLEVDDNFGGTFVIQENNLYAVPFDDIFRTYRFYFLPASGSAEIRVDGNVVWSYYIGSPSNMIWPNGNVMIGYMMDGSGSDKTIFDNAVISEVDDSALPVEMSTFEVVSLADKVSLKWATESELNNDYFTIERSRDGEEFHQLENVKGAGTINTHQSYSYFDVNPLTGVSYYRIVQTDFDGENSASEILSVQFESEDDGVFIFPNLLEKRGELQIKLPFVGEDIQIVIINVTGKEVLNQKFDSQDHLKMSVPSTSGVYIVHVIIEGEMYGTQKIVVR